MKRLPGIFLIVLLLVFVALFSIWVGSCEKQTLEVKVVDNKALYEQEQKETYRIRDSLARVLSRANYRADSAIKLNQQLMINIIKAENETDTVIINIPIRDAPEYSLFLSNYYRRYHQHTNH